MVASFFTLTGPDNDTYMWGSDDRLLPFGETLAFCETCGYKTDFDAVRPSFRLDSLKLAFSYTYDGYAIVSDEFRARTLHYTDESDFRQFATSDKFYCLIPSHTVEFDADRRKTRFEGYCASCGNWRAVAGATPAFLKSKPRHCLCRTDVLFGSGNSRSPLLICDQTFAESIRDLRGVELEPVAA